MLNRNFISFLAVILILSGCSSAKRKSSGGTGRKVIMYINLGAIYKSAVSDDKEAIRLNAIKNKLLNTVDRLRQELLEKSEDREKLVLDLKSARARLNDNTRDINAYKRGIYNNINRAVKEIADKIDADFILNIGDEVIYAKKKYDITEDVIREIIRVKRRSAPVTR